MVLNLRKQYGTLAGALWISLLLSIFQTGQSIGNAATANFWLAAPHQNQGPDEPTVQVLAGSTAEIDIWGRPATGMNLQAFALNLVAEQSHALNFEFIEVHNPLLEPITGNFARRHQLIYDSTLFFPDIGFPVGIDLQSDRINGFSGTSFLNGAPDLDEGGGIGPNCQDQLCELDTAGQPMWKIATARFQAGAAGTSTPLFLEIATQGLWHSEENPTDTSARFGMPDDVLHEWGVPMEGFPDPVDHRNTHMGMRDAIIEVVATLPDADFNDDNDVDGADFLTWQRGYLVGSSPGDGDADGDGVVNDIDLSFWRTQYGSVSILSAHSVPEPSSGIIFLVCMGLAVFLRRFDPGPN